MARFYYPLEIMQLREQGLNFIIGAGFGPDVRNNGTYIWGRTKFHAVSI